MKKFLASLLLTFALVLAPYIFAQDNGGNVVVESNQQGSTVYFSLDNNTGGTVCAFPYVSSSENVYGSVVPMIQLNAGESNVNIGAYAQSNPNADWYIYIGAKYRSGTCA